MHDPHAQPPGLLSVIDPTGEKFGPAIEKVGLFGSKTKDCYGTYGTSLGVSLAFGGAGALGYAFYLVLMGAALTAPLVWWLLVAGSVAVLAGTLIGATASLCKP